MQRGFARAWPGAPSKQKAILSPSLTDSFATQFGPFTHALAQWTLIARHGASERLATPEWVANHWRCVIATKQHQASDSQSKMPICRFIVWKLASYERAYPALFVSRRALSADRVLDELRMRYEREHNRCGHQLCHESVCTDARPHQSATSSSASRVRGRFASSSANVLACVRHPCQANGA